MNITVESRYKRISQLEMEVKTLKMKEDIIRTVATMPKLHATYHPPEARDSFW
jgi:hypothetical protein